MRLRLNGLSVACVIGDRPDERTRLQELRVDVTLDIPTVASQSDILADTVDYAALTEQIRAVLVTAKCQMIECAARQVHDACAEACSAVAGARVVGVTITKVGTIPGLASVSVDYP